MANISAERAEAEPYRTLREKLGFLPAIFPAQELLPRVVDAEAAIAGAFLLAPGALPRELKEQIVLAVAAQNANPYCVTAHAHVLGFLGVDQGHIRALIDGRHTQQMTHRDAALVDFSLRLARQPTSIGAPDFHALRDSGISDEEILEAILTTGLAQFLCTLSTGLGVDPDFEPVPISRPSTHVPDAATAGAPGATAGPYVRSVPKSPEEFPPFDFFRRSFGFIPNIFRAQTLKPEALEAEAQAIRDILLTEDVLSRKQKEYILLVISAANLNTYCVAVHCEMLRALGVAPESSDQIAVDHHRSDLSPADKALLDAALTLATKPAEFGDTDRQGLLRAGFSESQVLEAIVMASLTNFLNTLQMGLGTRPDFRPRRDFLADWAARTNPAAASNRPTESERTEDPDAPLVASARGGDMAAFETLVRRHQTLVYRTLVGVTGRPEDAEDGTQSVFMRVFQKIGGFSGAARFSTWLTRIAINEGLERLRSRRPMESLDEGPEADFRPSDVTPWVEDPERVYARVETRRIVQQELAKLPALYRTAVMLRDIQQMPTAEAAAALEIPIPTLKTRLLRGRLMMREALAAHFAAAPAKARSV